MPKRLQQKAKPVDDDNSSDEETKKSKNKHVLKKTSNTSKSNESKAKPGFLSLEASMNDKKLQVFKNEKFVCIRDKYPKSKIHLLLIPLLEAKLHKVEQIIQLPNAIEFLKELRTTANHIIASNATEFKNANFNIGFHAVQSMQPLHMHIISDDFKSDCLKNKKHWNSFCSPYFVKLDDIIGHLENDLHNLADDYFKSDKFNLRNRAQLDEYLKMDLKCHKCNKTLNNIPNLKAHLNTH